MQWVIQIYVQHVLCVIPTLYNYTVIGIITLCAAAGFVTISLALVHGVRHNYQIIHNINGEDVCSVKYIIGLHRCTTTIHTLTHSWDT